MEICINVMKYTFTIEHRNDNFELNDCFKEWITATSAHDAIQQIEKAYPQQLGYKCILDETDQK